MDVRPKKSSLKNDLDRLAFYCHGDRAGPSAQSKDSPLLIEHLTPLEKKWDEAWDHLDRVQDLKPSRVPLRSKRTKRCPTCQHILLKPKQKAQSIRFKIKLIASNYLPLIELHRKRIATSTKLGTDCLTSGISAACKSAAAGRTGAEAGSNPLLGQVDMLVTFTYQSDDLNDELEESPTRPTPASQKQGGGTAQEEVDEGNLACTLARREGFLPAL
ncbi:hypothetical protein PGTUg99_034758 [Puccinia graminis f. sp. tritici]|uniref:Dynactin subunit 4 n=1 Tax=Puccinia graminis f. sp. tritici TaxID=56615 RepID=A0A5B0SAX0_PUCGR|nr:hypothetical protein PGTUg99_034758 [Puccinia graminis f. sp. tritici]